MGLTVKGIDSLRRKGEPGRHHDGDGLYLLIKSKSNVSWALRYQLHGRERWMGLGPARLFSLAEARERAKSAQRQLVDKIDPLAARQAERAAVRLAEVKAMTFAQAAQAFFDQHESKWRNRKHAAQFISTLKEYVYPVIGTLPVTGIDTPLVLKVLERSVPAGRGYPAGSFWKTRPETASRVRARIEQVLGWAGVRGLRQGDNPARWRGHLDQVLPARGQTTRVEHHPAMPYAELPAFMAELKRRQGVAARALEFTILTASRTGETIGARWDEIQLDHPDGPLWVVPAPRMKAHKEHRVPLGPAVVELLASLHRDGDSDQGYLFIGSRPGTSLSNTSMFQLLKRMGRLDITVHGFRSAFRGWAAERTNFAREVAEMALAHTISDKVERAYQRKDLLNKRRQLAEAWANFCLSPPPEASRSVVVPIRSGEHG